MQGTQNSMPSLHPGGTRSFEQRHYGLQPHVYTERTAGAALKAAWFLQAAGRSIELQIVHHSTTRLLKVWTNRILAFDGVPALSVSGGEGPHVGPSARVVVAEAALLFVLRSVPAAGARVRAAAQQQSCSSSKIGKLQHDSSHHPGCSGVACYTCNAFNSVRMLRAWAVNTHSGEHRKWVVSAVTLPCTLHKLC
jgi:hypothetical protein